ncbi:MAG TPA: thioredoxin domain-containing protein [Candidatus Paceibacterota bacterium]|nr:thioredoxin domain-containing protein [Candidatus Paceibacterota bacterium]
MEKNADSQSFLDKYLTPIAVLVGALILAGAFAFGNAGERRDTTASGEPQGTEVDINDVKTNTGPYVGSPDAPVTMAVWFDFQCRFCKQFENSTLTEVQQKYVDKGLVRIVYKDFQFLGPASNDAALYSRAVWEAHPDRWNEWFAAMFADGSESTANLAAMNALSTSLGLDAARIEALMNANEAAYQAAIDTDRAEGQGFGVNGTPASIVGTTYINGAQPFAVVAAAIDAELE